MSQQLPAAPAHPTRLITNSASLGVDLTNIMLEKIATDGEVLVAVSNMALAGDGGMLQTFVEGVKSAGISNAMVVAIDQQTVQQVSIRRLPW